MRKENCVLSIENSKYQSSNKKYNTKETDSEKSMFEDLCRICKSKKKREKHTHIHTQKQSYNCTILETKRYRYRHKWRKRYVNTRNSIVSIKNCLHKNS